MAIPGNGIQIFLLISSHRFRPLTNKKSYSEKEMNKDEKTNSITVVLVNCSGYNGMGDPK